MRGTFRRDGHCSLSAHRVPLARLQERFLLNQLAHPVDEDAHLRREVTASRVHHRYGELLRRPVSEYLHELPRLQVRSRHVVRDLHDSKTHETGDDIGVVIVDSQYAIECELDLLPVSRELPAHARAAATGRAVHHLFTGYLVAEAGKIKLLRETFNPLAMAQAQLPNGVAEIGPPGDEVHSF